MYILHRFLRGPSAHEHRLLGLLQSSDMKDALETADGAKSGGPNALVNEAERLAKEVMSSAKVTWLGALNNFRLSKETYRQDVIKDVFLKEADRKIKSETDAAVTGIWKWVRWGKHAEYVTLKYKVAAQLVEDARGVILARQSRVEQLLEASDFSKRLREKKGETPVASTEKQAILTALSAVGDLLRAEQAKLNPTPPKYEQALGTEPKLRSILKHFKVGDPAQLAHLLERNEKGYSDLQDLIRGNSFADEFGNELPGARDAALQMAKDLAKSRGYRAFKIVKPNLNALSGPARLQALMQDEDLDASVDFVVPGRQKFRARVIRKHPQYPNAVILQAPDPSNPGKQETLVLDAEGPQLAYRTAGAVRVTRLADAQFSIAA